MATATNHRIDVTTNDLLTKSGAGPCPAKSLSAQLPEPVFPQFPAKLNDPGPVVPPEHRKWTTEQIFRKTRGWLLPYLKSRVLPGLSIR